MAPRLAPSGFRVSRMQRHRSAKRKDALAVDGKGHGVTYPTRRDRRERKPELGFVQLERAVGTATTPGGTTRALELAGVFGRSPIVALRRLDKDVTAQDKRHAADMDIDDAKPH